MLGYGKTQIIGNLGSDPIAAELPSGDKVTNFSVAVNRRYKDREGKRQEKTDWYRVSVFNQLSAACAENLRRGSAVFVAGDLRVRLYDSKEGKQVSVEVIANTVRFLGSPQPGKDSSPNSDSDEAFEDEAPF